MSQPEPGAPPEIDCSKGTYHANTEDPTSFYQCSDGIPYRHNCPAGLIFNPELNVCDYPDQVKPYWLSSIDDPLNP